MIEVENDNAAVPAVTPALPRTTYDQFAPPRLRRVKDGYLHGDSELTESIDP